MDKLPQISAECFTYETWKADFWAAPGLVFAGAIEEDNLIRAIKEYGIGYCRSNKLKIRPKGDEYVAVMCERDGKKFWFHMFKDDVSEILGE